MERSNIHCENFKYHDGQTETRRAFPILVRSEHHVAARASVDHQIHRLQSNRFF